MPKVLTAIVAVALLTACNLEKTVAGIVRDEEQAGVTLNIAECGIDEAGNAFAIVEITTAEEKWGTVLFNVSMVTEDNVVIGSGSTSARSVSPGRTYQERVVISLSSEPPANVTCEADLDFASRN